MLGCVKPRIFLIEMNDVFLFSLQKCLDQVQLNGTEFRGFKIMFQDFLDYLGLFYILRDTTTWKNTTFVTWQ